MATLKLLVSGNLTTGRGIGLIFKVNKGNFRYFIICYSFKFLMLLQVNTIFDLQTSSSRSLHCNLKAVVTY